MSSHIAAARNVLVVALIAPLGGNAQTAERFTLTGNSVAVYNIAGEVTVARGTGNAVVVEVTRGGADASQLRMVERTVNGRPALCVVYPAEHIVYRRDGNNGRSSTTHTSSGDPCDENRSSGVRRRVEVGTRGDGVEVWADLRILVPQGRDVQVDHLVGRVEIDGVDATLSLDVASAPVTSANTSGRLAIDAGSGRVNVSRHRGALSIDVGSGGITVSDVEAPELTLDTGSGSITATNVTTEELTIDTGSGSVEFSGGAVRTGRVDTGSGSVRLTVASIDDLDVDSGSGGVTLTVARDLNARLSITTGSGGIQSDFPTQVRSMSRNRLDATVGNGSGNIRIHTGSGAVRLRRGQ